MVAMAAVPTVHIPIPEAPVAQGHTLELIGTLRTRITALEAHTPAPPVTIVPIPARSRQLFTRMHLIHLVTARRALDPTAEGLPEVVKPNASSCARLVIRMADRGTS
jgi:hypothetical protein